MKINIKYKPIIDEYAKKTIARLRTESPKSARGRYTPYFAGWDFFVDKKTEDDYGGKVWNSTNYQLTHLLENGHLIVNKKGGVGWASPQAHINPVFQEIKPKFIQAMRDVGIEIET